MDIAGIRDAINRQPFRPFQLRLADGRAALVNHPDFIMISPNNRRIAVYAPDDSMSIIEPLLVVSIDYPAESTPNPPPGSNGNGSPAA
jgi:hypothetical protein